MKLLIVESPGKCKKIKSVLGNEWIVKASVGHIRDLPEKELGFDRETLRPVHEVLKDKKKVVSDLRKYVKSAEIVYLATDLDREGEGIAWHLKDELRIKKYERVVFKEITKQGILSGMKNTRKLDMNLVRACEARRLIDRMVGYLVSPELNKAYSRKGLSAGRVQIPAVILVAQRELEIRGFKSTPFYEVILEFKTDNKEWYAQWNWSKYLKDKNADELTHWTNKDFAEKVSKIKNLKIVKVTKNNSYRKPFAPFTTSTMQQSASSVLKMEPESCMGHAQKLYENGLITYIRTDSYNMSDDAIGQINDWLINNGFSGSVLDKPNTWKSKGGSQEAHECIRPSNIEVMQEDIDSGLKLDAGAKSLYGLIWRRAVASQMKPAVYDVKKIYLESIEDVDGYKMEFIAGSKTLVFAGWLKLIKKDIENDDEKDESREIDVQEIPEVKEGTLLISQDGVVLSKKTSPPSRFTQASLIKKLESEEIGRPSTYASIMGNIKKRKYIRVEKRKLFATDLGISVVNTLSGRFNFSSLGYTKIVETDLDYLAKGKSDYHSLVRTVYDELIKELEAFSGTKVEGFDEDSGVKSSKKSKSTPVKTGEKCPKCDGSLVERTVKSGKNKGKKFSGCENYPGCDFTNWS